MYRNGAQWNGSGCTGRGTFDGLESEILDGIPLESTTPMIALTAESGFREVIRRPIPRCRRKVSTNWELRMIRRYAARVNSTTGR